VRRVNFVVVLSNLSHVKCNFSPEELEINKMADTACTVSSVSEYDKPCVKYAPD
jgi:hypothetical protein